MATPNLKHYRNSLQIKNKNEFANWKKQIVLGSGKRNISTNYGKCPRCKNDKCYIRSIPNHTSMAGVASRKPSTMAICIECESNWPIE